MLPISRLQLVKGSLVEKHGLQKNIAKDGTDRVAVRELPPPTRILQGCVGNANVFVPLLQLTGYAVQKLEGRGKYMSSNQVDDT